MLKRLAAGTVIALSLIAATTGSASAAASSCPSSVSSALEVNFPGTVAKYRKVWGDMTLRRSAGDWTSKGEVHLEYFAGNGKLEWKDTWKLNGYTTFWIESLNRKNRLVVTAEFTNETETCQVSKIKRIRGTDGLRMKVRVRPGWTLLGDGAEIETSCPTGPRRLVSTDPLMIYVISKGQAKSIRVKQPCDRAVPRGKPGTIRGRNWVAKWDPYLDLMDLGLRGRSRKAFRVTIVAKQFIWTLNRTALRVRWIDRPGRRIWEGTDAFINYCINQLVTIKSENLRLYCTTPDESGYRVVARRYK